MIDYRNAERFHAYRLTPVDQASLTVVYASVYDAALEKIKDLELQLAKAVAHAVIGRVDGAIARATSGAESKSILGSTDNAR